jgi:hypothetical protein
MPRVNRFITDLEHNIKTSFLAVRKKAISFWR